MRRSTIEGFAATVLVVAGLGAVTWQVTGSSRGAENDQGFLAGLISRALSTPTSEVHIGGVDGALSSAATIHDIVISDRDGVWLRLDTARIEWRRTALVFRRLEIDKLAIGHLEILRKPVPSITPVKDADKPILPELPVKVEIKTFTLADLDLGKAILGTAFRATATGDTKLGSPTEGLVFNLDGRRLDSPGTVVAALGYVPSGNALTVKVDLDEPSGGILSKVGHIPGEPPVRFHFAGDGTLDAFTAGLDFRAGPTIDAVGTVGLHRHDTGRDLTVDLGGHLGPLLPAPAASIFEGQTALTGKTRIGDDGAVALEGLTLASHLARLDARGTYGTDRMLDVSLIAKAVPNDGDVSKAGDASIRKLSFDGTVKGPIAAPTIAATLSLADARLPEGSLATLEATFAAIPNGEVLDTATRVSLDGRMIATGIVPRDAALARAIGGGATLSLEGVTDMAGNGTFRRIEARTPTVGMTYVGDLSPNRIAGHIGGDAGDLSRFGDLAGLHLAGRATAGIDVDGSLKNGTVRAYIAAEAKDLSTGLAAVDRLSGGHVTFAGKIARSGDRYSLDGIAIDGAHVSARMAGMLEPRAADLTAHVALPDLVHADPALTGHASADLHVTGGLEHPDVSFVASLDAATAMGRPIPHLALVATVADPRGAMKTKLTLDGMVDAKPASGLVAIARRADASGYDVSALDIAIGSVSLHGSGGIDADNLARGSLNLAAGNLDDLSPLMLTRLGGSLSLDATLSTADGGQAVVLKGSGADIRALGAAVHRVTLRADASDLYRRPVLDADARIDQATIGGQTIATVSFGAKGTPTRSTVDLTARAAGFDLAASGAIVPGADTRLDLMHLSARRGGRSITLLQPATIKLARRGAEVERMAIGIDGGRVTIDGLIGKTLDLAVDAKAIPLSAVDIVEPGMGLGGVVDADAHLVGKAGAPEGPYRIRVKRLVAPRMKSAGVPPLDIAATGRLNGGRASLDAKIDAGSKLTVTVAGTLPLDPGGAFDLSMRGRIDAAIANAQLGPSGRGVTGIALVDAKLGGTMAVPRISGGATMDGGTFRDVLLGVRLDSIAAKLVARGDRVVIERLTAVTPNDGTLTATGQVNVDPSAGFPGQVRVRGHQAQLVSSSLITATSDLAIDISGALARDPRVSGRVDVTHVDVGIPDRLPGTLKPIDGIGHVNAPGNVRARLALADQKARQGAGSKGRAALFDARLDVVVAAPNRIFVRGRGVDAELGGELRVSGTTNRPTPNGAFDLRHGTISALGKTLTFTKGKLTFTGDLMPELDFAAEIQATGVKAQIAVTGPAAAPVFAFTSTPELPQDEVLSRVLFQKPSGSLSGFQALQLAQAAAQFSGGGDGAFESVRKSLGLDALDVGAGAGGGASVGLSRAISDRVSIGVKTGATADQTGISADVDVTKHVRVQSDVRSNGSTSVGVGTELEY